MHIEQAAGLTAEFYSSISSVAGKINYIISPPMDAARFPDELHKLGGKLKGFYMLSSKEQLQA